MSDLNYPNLTLVKSYQLFLDGVELEKPTVTIDCHPFIITIGLITGIVKYSFANAKVEELAKQHKQMERLENLISEIKNRFANYDDLRITKALIDLIEHDLNKLLQSFRALYRGFDLFYRESLHS